MTATPNHKQKGLTLLESMIALGLVTLAIGFIAVSYNSDKHKAEQVISELQMAKAGVLRYNMDFPGSTNKLSSLLTPNGNADGWNGPYADTSARLNGDNLDISRVYPDTHLELVHEVIDGAHYQAVIVKGLAETGLRSAILAKCGDDCKPLPVRDDIGLLIQKVAAVSINGSGYGSHPNPGTPTPPKRPPTPWNPPNTTTPPYVPPVFPPPTTPPPPVNPPPPVSPPPPTPATCPDGSIKPANGVCPSSPPPPPAACQFVLADGSCADDPSDGGSYGGGGGCKVWSVSGGCMLTEDQYDNGSRCTTTGPGHDPANWHCN